MQAAGLLRPSLPCPCLLRQLAGGRQHHSVGPIGLNVRVAQHARLQKEKQAGASRAEQSRSSEQEGSVLGAVVSVFFRPHPISDAACGVLMGNKQCAHAPMASAPDPGSAQPGMARAESDVKSRAKAQASSLGHHGHMSFFSHHELIMT